jgi:hypothetical protein
MASVKIGKQTFELRPVPAMLSFSLTPLFASALGRAIRQVLIVIQSTGFFEDKDINELTLADVKTLVDGDGGFDRLKTILIKYGPDLAAALGETIGSIRPNDLQRLLRDLLREGQATCDGMPLFPFDDDKKLNEIFAGKPIAMWRLLLFALQVNYADFSVALGGSGPTSPGANPSPASSTSAPSGPSGGSSPSAGG